MSNIQLSNPLSTIALIGDKDNYYKDEKYHYCSSDCREAMTLTQHPGDGKYNISIFKVEYSRIGDHGYKRLAIDTFKTEKGIKLGMSKEHIIEKLGTCYITNDSSKNYIEINYRIESPKDSKTKLLERQNMPIYYATYKLRMNKLEVFEFGFEYP